MVKDEIWENPALSGRVGSSRPAGSSPASAGPGRGKRIWNGFKNGTKSFGRGAMNFFDSVGDGISRIHVGGGNERRNILILVLFVIAGLMIWFGFYPLIGIIMIIFLVLYFIFNLRFFREHDGAKFFLVLLLISAFLFFGLPMMKMGGLMSSDTYNRLMEGSVISTAKMLDFWKNFNPIAAWSAFWERQKSIATGEYFQGKVEENRKDEKLGIYLDEIQSIDPLLTEGDTAPFFINVRGKALDDPITLKLDCKTNDRAEKISSEKTIKIYTYDESTFDCKLANLKPGALKVNFTVEYDFRTLSYYKSYFMSQEKIRELRRQNMDPLDEFRVDEKNPVAVYTNGPIRIGMKTVSTQPVSIKPDTTELSALGITIDKRWDGYIKKINGVEIQVHKSMSLRECEPKMEKTDNINCINECYGEDKCIKECDNYNFYRMTEQGKEMVNKDINSRVMFKTIMCYVHSENRAELLGNSPLSIKYFRAIVDYTYVAEKSRTFYVKSEKKT